jgi:hypothetical protein
MIFWGATFTPNNTLNNLSDRANGERKRHKSETPRAHNSRRFFIFLSGL